MPNNNPIEKETETTSNQQKVYRPLYTEREIRNIIKEFIEGYISGQITIEFPDTETVLTANLNRGIKSDMKQAEKQATDFKVGFMHQIAICAGTEKATPEEMQQSTSQLFANIVSFRNSKRLQGVFHDYGTEDRINKLEEGMEKVNKLVEEIVDWLMKGK